MAIRSGFNKQELQMWNMESLLQFDTDRMFEDWGRPAWFVEVCQHFDAESGRREESKYASELSVIPAESQPRQVPNVSATLSLTRRLLLVRRSEIPDRAPLTSARIEFDDTPYSIQAVRESGNPGVLLLECHFDGLTGNT
ncbi:hypothetical protein SH661x_004004 [Planctomicrobium sp. SH661]|uniref:hypothetical protein n=1 Tax=Planctomicrobium sp. SH661 TaxID=3448124 RepID=UPI003F5BEE66